MVGKLRDDWEGLPNIDLTREKFENDACALENLV